MTLDLFLNWAFIFTLIPMIIFWFVRKKTTCFIFSVLYLITQVTMSCLNSNWFNLCFFSICLIEDVYLYKTNRWSCYGHFDD